MLYTLCLPHFPAQVDINDCASIPCANNGTCIDKVDAFECGCGVGYEGPSPPYFAYNIKH